MTRRRGILIAIILSVAVSVQAAYALPLSSIASLRAAVCCVQHCRHLGGNLGAAECCHVNRAAEDPASLSKSKPAGSPLAVAYAIPSWRSGVGPSQPGVAGLAARDVFSRPAPIFLIERSLRL